MGNDDDVQECDCDDHGSVDADNSMTVPMALLVVCTKKRKQFLSTPRKSKARYGRKKAKKKNHHLPASLDLFVAFDHYQGASKPSYFH